MLTVRFILNPRGDSVNTVVTAKRRFGRVRWGTPTGPGGTEVWVALQNLWTPGERAVRDSLVPLSRLSGVELQVAAETSRLMRIYRRYLEPRGYTFYADPDDPKDDLLVKYLTKGLT